MQNNQHNQHNPARAKDLAAAVFFVLAAAADAAHDVAYAADRGLPLDLRCYDAAGVDDYEGAALNLSATARACLDPLSGLGSYQFSQYADHAARAYTAGLGTVYVNDKGDYCAALDPDAINEAAAVFLDYMGALDSDNSELCPNLSDSEEFITALFNAAGFLGEGSFMSYAPPAARGAFHSVGGRLFI